MEIDLRLWNETAVDFGVTVGYSCAGFNNNDFSSGPCFSSTPDANCMEWTFPDAPLEMRTRVPPIQGDHPRIENDLGLSA